jgi:hypothetical protein
MAAFATLMQLRGLILHFPEERPYASFLDRLAYHSMDRILRSRRLCSD